MIPLTQEQKELVRQWVTEGAKLSEIQKRINEELKIPITFMEVRFLILDLGLNIKESESRTSSGVDLSKAAPTDAGEAPLEEQSVPGGVTVELDRVVKAGALVSGSVKFSDGETAGWSLDQFGRLALMAGRSGYQPSQEDLQAFQQELARLLQSRGF